MLVKPEGGKISRKEVGGSAPDCIRSIPRSHSLCYLIPWHTGWARWCQKLDYCDEQEGTVGVGPVWHDGLLELAW